MKIIQITSMNSCLRQQEFIKNYVIHTLNTFWQKVLRAFQNIGAKRISASRKDPT